MGSFEGSTPIFTNGWKARHCFSQRDVLKQPKKLKLSLKMKDKKLQPTWILQCGVDLVRRDSSRTGNRSSRLMSHKNLCSRSFQVEKSRRWRWQTRWLASAAFAAVVVVVVVVAAVVNLVVVRGVWQQTEDEQYLSVHHPYKLYLNVPRAYHHLAKTRAVVEAQVADHCEAEPKDQGLNPTWGWVIF